MHCVSFSQLAGPWVNSSGSLHFANELPTECINYTRNGRGASLADEVEVEHPLHRPGLHAAVDCQQTTTTTTTAQNPRAHLLDEASCFVMEESMF